LLPALFHRSGIEDHWLFGRSDGGSIALLYASRFPGKTSGIVVAAPHIHITRSV
jgi:pimeloyl-ACP methyl ester carboxylesterase